MVYCVVPRELEGDLLERLSAHYAGDPEVTVIVDRRSSERRRGPASAAERDQRVLRDRRRRRAVGEFPELYAEPERSA